MNKVMNRYRVWGEYGPTSHDYIVWFGVAKTPENAVKRAVKAFKKDCRWDRIGMDNVYCQLATTR